MINETQIVTNYTRWIQRLQNYKCFSQQMIDDMGERIRIGTWSMAEESGAAYDGALLDVVMNHLCSLAYCFNEVAFTDQRTKKMTHPYIKVNTDMLIRVLLLQHISKADIFVPQSEQWKAKKGMLYMYNPYIETTLKVGERTLFLCQKYGIYLNEDEYDALRVIDRMDEQSISTYTTPLALMVRMANQFACMEMRRQWEFTHKQQSQQIIEK